MNARKTSKNDGQVIRVISCGNKFAAPPADAALLLDCRGFINPHYDRKLRKLTGASEKVKDFLRTDPDVQALLACLRPLIAAVLPGLVTKSAYHKDEIKLVFACTGGKHRSRFFAIAAAEVAREIVAAHPDWDCRVSLNHRDQGRD